MAPLIVFRDRALDIDNLDENDELREAAEDLDQAFDYLDATLSSLTELHIIDDTEPVADPSETMKR